MATGCSPSAPGLRPGNEADRQPPSVADGRLPARGQRSEPPRIPVAQQRGGRSGILRARVKVALPALAAELAEVAELAGRLDALGDHLEPERVTERDRRADDRQVDLAVTAGAVDEATVDLERVHGELSERRQRGV